MKKTLLPNGLIAYEVTAEEMELINSPDVCDECNEHAPAGYLIPVLNHYMCPKCFNDWSKRCHNYPRDRAIELKRAAYFEHMIPTIVTKETLESKCAVKTNVIKVRFVRDGVPSGREYTYFSNTDVETGDIVDLESRGGVAQGIVTAIDVPEEEIAPFKDTAKAIIGKYHPAEDELKTQEVK
jgi:hypothetical protein